MRIRRLLFPVFQLLVAALTFLAGVPASAAAFGPENLRESCRIATSPDTGLGKAIALLEHCGNAAPRDAFGTIWVAYERPRLAQQEGIWRVLLDNHRVRQIDLWLVQADGRTKRLKYDPDSPEREWASGNYFSLIFHNAQPVERVILRLGRAENMTFIRMPVMMSARAFGTVERNRAMVYGVAVGMLGLTVLFHLSLFVAMRRRFQLIYCGHAAMLFLYAACYSGLVRLIVPELTAIGVSRTLNFSMLAATATGIAFVVHFLGHAIVPRWLRLWTSVAAVGSLLGALALLTVPQRWSALVYPAANVITTHTILLAGAILVWAATRRNRAALLLTASWALPIFVSLLYPARNFGLIPATWVPDGMLLAACTIECLILSFAVAARIRDLRIEHERAHERHQVLERQAQTDALTGLANRRGFGDALTRAAAAQADAAPIAMLVIDIDHFKRVNDQHGHATGDAILRHVAGDVARVAGSGAIVARYGGEEFVVALRGYDLARAGTIAERIRISVGITLDMATELPPVTISIGVAAGLSTEIETILADADCALYRAKNEGRNRVMLADGPLMYAAAA